MLNRPTKKKLREEYVTGHKPMRILADHFSVSINTIKRWLEDAGIERRDMHESHKGIPAWNKGKPMTLEQRHALSKKKSEIGAWKGSGNPKWLGGNRKQVQRSSLIHQGKYKKWRREVLSRDEYECRVCGSETRLEVHHIIPFKDCMKNPGLLYGKDNGITLCKSCHDKTRRHEHEYADFLRRIIE